MCILLDFFNYIYGSRILSIHSDIHTQDYASEGKIYRAYYWPPELNFPSISSGFSEIWASTIQLATLTHQQSNWIQLVCCYESCFFNNVATIVVTLQLQRHVILEATYFCALWQHWRNLNVDTLCLVCLRALLSYVMTQLEITCIITQRHNLDSNFMRYDEQLRA